MSSEHNHETNRRPADSAWRALAAITLLLLAAACADDAEPGAEDAARDALSDVADAAEDAPTDAVADAGDGGDVGGDMGGDGAGDAGSDAGEPDADLGDANDAGDSPDGEPDVGVEWADGCWHPETAAYAMDCDLMCTKLVDVCGLEQERAECEATCARMSYYLPGPAARAMEGCVVDDLDCGTATLFPYVVCADLIVEDDSALVDDDNVAACAALASDIEDAGCTDEDGLAGQLPFICDTLGPVLVPETLDTFATCVAAGDCADIDACLESSVCF